MAGTIYTFELAGGADDASDYSALFPGELDPVMVIYDSQGNQISFNDDISFPTDINSKVSFLAQESGVYYLDAFSYAPWTGGYSITSTTQDLADLDPLESLLWDSAANVTFDATDTAYVYFGEAGNNFGAGGDSYGWNEYEIQQVMLALEEYEYILGVNYEITTNEEDATFRLFTTTGDFGAYFYPQDPAYGDLQGVGAFNVNSGGWAFDQQQSLTQGGFSFAVILHEFGHAHGLAHPHDTGGGSEIMVGVVGSSSRGIFDLNQGVYTVMSYNDGWELHPDGPHDLTAGTVDYGWTGTLSAFDIAALQARYGVTERATGDDVYTLSDINAPGTFYQTIWDSAGTDEIRYEGERDAQIDLLAATIDYTPTGGGVVSFVHDIFGGYTIANGVVIENATGGAGNDVLLGNAADNVLTGNGGSDYMMGREGDDTFVIDGQFTGDGVDTIADFSSGDTLRLTNVAGIKVVFEEIDGDTFVTFDGTTVVVLEGTDAVTALSGTDFRNSPKSTTLIIDGEELPLQISGTPGNDKIIGIAGVENVIAGNAGDDVITGRGKDDVLLGNAGNDIIKGANGNDVLFGGRGDDELFGGNGSDQLHGDRGNDILVGGNGDDILTGGAGSDIFVFDPSSDKAGIDTVTDFNYLEDSIQFESNPNEVLFVDGTAGAEMFVDGTLMAIFEGVSAADMAGPPEMSAMNMAGMTYGVNDIMHEVVYY